MSEFLVFVGIVIAICVCTQVDDCNRRDCISECVASTAAQACEELCK